MIEPKKIMKSRRKTIALIIDRDGELIVRAPFYASDREIASFVAQKQDWIVMKAKEAKRKKEELPPIQLGEGEEILFLGKSYQILRRNITKPVLKKGFLFVPDSVRAKEQVIGWYKEQALQYLRVQMHQQATLMGVEPQGIKITSAKTRWGSCSYQNHMNFSWHLIMCPKEVVDYVVVHELCHILHKDHSKAFWNSVEQYDRDYRVHEQWLKDNRRIMEILD